ncbi:hypothetical protein AB6A40_008019 [Gnathostoma spinigerum]|uniref:Phospholipid/glycerol acyltransferase domain-containing protein n=1 Tax=Gnathostoma spinigerum TaxID=75299 RepID=A0ABD6EP53_9BILA
MGRRMLKITKLNHVYNEDIGQRTRAVDVVLESIKSKLRWAGHVARLKDDKWTKKLSDWYPMNYKRLKEHVDDPNKLPIVIFPEGTCINNTSVMMFKKGCFEIGSTIYPIAMKYDVRLGDAFWNSSEQSYGEYLFRMMTSWAIICDVWYLPPMSRLPDEGSISFARRVKRAIAKKGGLVDLEWDGGLKRSKVPPRLIAEHQKLYWESLSRKTSINKYEAQSKHLQIVDGVSTCTPDITTALGQSTAQNDITADAK